jgi:predicted AlkP superfamily pyrophosphatase or phosphodiesterase
MKRFFAAMAPLAVVLGLVSCATPPPPPPAELLILVSIDGFRWDYLRQYEAPVLQELATGGVHATRLTPSFPTKTFPNHYTLVTGLYPAHHGIVGNWFYDPASGETFGMGKPASNTEERWWAGGEPVWITAEKQGVRSACFFWPGSETTQDGVRPTFYKTFDKKLQATERVDGLLAWLALPPAQRPRFGTLYFDVVDTVGHKHGPVAPETGAAVKEVDEALARLLAGLDALGLRDRTDLVIVSDHGMSEQSPGQVIFLEDLMNVSQVQVDSTGPMGGVRPKPGTVTAAELVAQIRAKAPPQLQAWLRDETPEHLHFRGNPRIPEIVLLADDHWNIEGKAGWPKRVLTYSKGGHGWDPATPNMGALFIAHGPSFRRQVELPEAENIQVYNLLCAALGLKPAPNDGDQRLVRAALAK